LRPPVSPAHLEHAGSIMLTDMLSLLTMALSRFQSNFGDPETLFSAE